MNELMDNVNRQIITPAMSILPAKMDSQEARVLMLAIGWQESRLIHRYQVITGGGKGPARGLWQFERGGGVHGVMTHPASQALAKSVCNELGVAFDRQEIWEELEYDDVLAACFARLLLWTDAKPLPRVNMQGAAWNYYTRVWRPGKPHPETWPTAYGEAVGLFL